MRPGSGGEERGVGTDETVASNPGAAAASDAVAETVASQPRVAGGDATIARGSSTRDPDYDDLKPVAPEHYILDGAIARGGMGQIIRARDRRLGRAVAIKELRVSTPDTIARFRREVKLTARLQHPSIVTVHEAGTWPSGEPFFAMEMIAGQPFDAVIRATTSWQERIALLPHVLAVADALAYAHSRGVIHRDLKPANILVGQFGETVVIDWGLARDVLASDGAPSVTPELASDDTHETVAGAVLGTPAYMPPEQARGERVDERADVYAIGALAYHLLTGKAPYEGKSVEAILAAVMARPPTPLATVEPAAPSDLVAIIEKAMARDVADRYPTGRSLAEDLRRFQTGQLVGAHRYTRRERLRRFVRKYRLALAVAGIGLALLAAIGAFSVSQIVDERDHARAARALAETRGREAAAQRDAAEKLVGYMLADLKPSLERVGRLDVMKRVSKEVDGYYSQLGTTSTLDAAAIARRAEAVRTLGDVLDASGDIAGARRSYEHAIAMLESQPAPDPIALAGARIDLAIMLEVQGELDAATAALERAGATLATATEKSPRAELARARLFRWKGIVLFDRDDHTAATTALDQAIAVGTAAAKAHPAARDLRFELSKAHDRRSDARNAQSNTAGALADAKASLALREQLEREDPQDLPVRRAMAVSWDKLFNLAIVEDRIADAEHAAARQIEIIEALVRHDPSNRAWMLTLVIALSRPADLAFERDDFQEGARRQARAVTIAKQLADLDPSNLEARIELGKAMTKLGEHLLFAGEHDRARSTLATALGMFEQLAIEVPGDPTHTQITGEIHEMIGSVHAQRADAAAAIEAFTKSVAIAEATLRASPTGGREKAAVATKQFHLARAIANVPARQAEGIAGMQRAIAALRELERANDLTPYDIERIPELEKLAKAYRYVRKPRATDR